MVAVSDALTSGNDIEALTALREHLAAALVDADERAMAGISREYRAVLAELRRLGAGKEVSALDEIAARRARRRAAGPAAATDQARAAGGGDVGSGGV